MLNLRNLRIFLPQAEPARHSAVLCQCAGQKFSRLRVKVRVGRVDILVDEVSDARARRSRV